MLEELRGKKIAVVGLGKNNQHLAEFLKSEHLEFDVIDGWKNPDELIGKLDNYQIIFRSPGLPYLSEAVQQAISHGVEVSSQTKLFFANCPCPIIGVTGTKGKGTTSSLIAKILSAEGGSASGGEATAGKKVWLAGNIGRDPFEFFPQINPSDIVVLELSSFQLQDLGQSPTIAVVLSITPDHLNHHQNFDEYIKAKSNIIAHQFPTDFAVLHPSLPDWFKKRGDGKKFFIDPNSVIDWPRKILGKHNLENIAAAAIVAQILNIDEDIVKKAVADFEPLPHRLQIIRVKNGVTFIDDSISTNEETAIAAIKTFTQPLILILGGSDKGLEYKNLGTEILEAKNLKAVIVVGEVSGKILDSVQGFGGQIFKGSKNMAEIFDQIKSIAKDGDAVLLSPAAASFDMFKDYKDRGEQFVEEVNRL